MISVAVLVSDEEYAAGLEKYLSAQSSGNISFGVYTKEEGFEGFIGEHLPPVIVAEEGLRIDDKKIPCIRLLKKGGKSEEGEGIGMYRNLNSVAADITKEVIAFVGHEIDRDNEGKQRSISDSPQTKIIEKTDNLPEGYADGVVRRSVKGDLTQITCVCSPFGGVCSSTFAFALALYYSKGERTLFVSFDPFFDMSVENDINTAGGLGRLIYLLDQKNDLAIEKCTQRIGGLDYICGADHWTDICDMKKEHADRLIDLVNKESYKHLVLDTKLFGAASIPILRSAGKIWVPCRAGEQKGHKMQEWSRQLTAIGVDPAKVSCLEVPFDGLISNGCERGMLLKGKLGRFIEETEGKRYVR